MTGLPVLGRRMTGVEVIPISGLTWAHPRLSEVVSPDLRVVIVPELCAGVGVEGVDGAVLGGDDQNVVRDAGDGETARDEERLGVDQAVGGDGEEFAEVRQSSRSPG